MDEAARLAMSKITLHHPDFNERDDFGSHRPLDAISSNRPILILDEPLKQGRQKRLEALARFKPLLIPRSSATHRTTHDMIHRLDALGRVQRRILQ